MKFKMQLSFFLLVIATIVGNAQVNFEQFKNYKPRNIGPAGMSGRVTAIDAVYANPDIIYIGAASGGVWKTENGGASWEPIFDEQPTQNIGAVAITQSNPSVVWVGTGEGNPRNSVSLGEGIYKSLDGGKNWKLMGLEKTRNIHRIIIDPNDANTVYVAAIGNPYGIHAERGVYKTTDGGNTWNKILYTNDTSGCAELVIDPTNPNKLMANMWQHQRNPWSFKSGGPGSGLYTTWDAGKTWKKLGTTEGIPDSVGRIGLAIAPSDPKRIYAMIESKKNALYRSDDGGFKWYMINNEREFTDNRPFYFQDIRVDPQNENRLYNIYQMISMSEDGGKTFKTIIPYSGVHPDHHAWWIHPTDPSLIINGNDGGIAISHDRGRSWQFDEKLPLGQFYHINTDNEIPYNVMGGLQDNGSWHGPAYIWASGGIRNSYWQSVGGGDGFDVIPDPDDSKWVYSMSQGGNLGRTKRTTGESWSIKPPAPDLNTRIRYNWNAAFAQDPFDNNTIYYGSQFVHKSTSKGTNWSIISPDLTINSKEQQRQDENGGLTIDITNAENHNTLLCIEPSKKEKGVLWVGSDDGLVHLTRDGGKTWNKVSANIKGLPVGCWITQIRASRYNAGEAWVVANQYRLADFAPYIYRTTDYGKTWTRFVDENKVKGYALCMIQDPVQPNLFFVGTEQGLWISLNGGSTFAQYKNGYPSVSTYDLAIQERESDLVIATFGRAIYILDNINPLRALAANNGSAIEKKLLAFEPVTAYQAEFNSPMGIEYSTYGLYEADNKRGGAAIPYYVKQKAKSDTSKLLRTDSVTVKIYTNTNQLIRTFKAKCDTGYNTVYWNYETKGQRQPGSPKPKPTSAEPANGFTAAPGTYKVVLSQGKEADSVNLVVKYDPRSTYNETIKNAQKQLLEKLGTHSAKLTTAMDKLTDADETIKKVETQIKDMEGKDIDSLRKVSKALTDSIKNIREFIVGKRNEKQGYGVPYQLTTTGKLQEARRSILGKDAMPAANDEQLIAEAELLVDGAVSRVEAFMTNSWKKYRTQVESTPMKLFKDN
jgi:photosystem II stability/assembly factor-like uncharacterized protein